MIKKAKVYKGKKILLVGLGRLGGGIAAAKYFASRGADVTVSDALEKKDLLESVQKLKGCRITYAFGGQKKEDFEGKDYIIFNQAIPEKSPWVRYAKKKCKRVYSDLTFFLSSPLAKKCGQVWVTGTRGKTTTTTWIGHILKTPIVGGNMPQRGMYWVLERLEKKQKGKCAPVALELSSFQLEYLKNKTTAPHVAVITNLYPDHLNRHGTMEEYMRVKSLVFTSQSKDDFLILNADNVFTKKFLSKKPKAQVVYVSTKRIPHGSIGLVYTNESVWFWENGKKEKIAHLPGFVGHTAYNLLQAMLASHLMGLTWDKVVGRVGSLPQIPFREERIYKDAKVEIYNDSAATSPEGACAAIRRFASKKTVYICGGTDKMLEFKPLAKDIRTYVPMENIYFLNGSGTKKLLALLPKTNRVYETLDEIVSDISKKKGIKKIVFSPGAASFEKFKNEFERGKKFTLLVQKYFNRA